MNSVQDDAGRSQGPNVVSHGLIGQVMDLFIERWGAAEGF